jgi:LysM repeat protein
LPNSDTQLDERKEPHFIRGMNLVNQMDYTGAIEEFEKTLEENPRNASARFELGWLYEDKAGDPAAAIYNYDRYLKFSSTQDKADLVKQHINSCKLELTKSVTAFGPQPSGAQRELERVTLENKDLRTQLADLQTQLAKAKAAIAAYSNAPRPSPEPPRPEAAHPVERRSPTVTDGITPLPPSTPRTYVIRSGDTLAGVARRYGVTINALSAANPRVRATHLLVGQTLNIPRS